MQTRREKVRQTALDEIRSLSWDTVKKHGIQKLTVNGIARQMGMTPPAFYRYYKSRDELIKTLVIDAYKSFRSALESARDKIPEEQPVQRLMGVFRAYREWAVNNPNMFGLFAGKRVCGFESRDPQVLLEADEVYEIFVGLYHSAWSRGFLNITGSPLKMPSSYLSRIRENKKKYKEDVPVGVINLGINAACLVHGMISLEISGRLDIWAGDPGQFYEYQVMDLMTRFGMSPP